MEEQPQVYGYNGRILLVDLTSGTFSVEEPDPGFYRTYLGGGLLGTYYVYRDMPAGADALSPQNVLVFAPSVTTGAGVVGVSRFAVVGKSPLTGAIGESQCGGSFGPRLKHAGFDAVVVSGRAADSVYLLIDAGGAELHDAAHLRGKLTAEAEALIREELDDRRVEVAQCGPAGENLVRYACVVGGLTHFAGRTGMGAVMGSKNLRAVAVRGARAYAHADEEAVKALAQRGSEGLRGSDGLLAFQKHGTSLGVEPNAGLGNTVTRNFQEGAFEEVANLAAERMTESILKSNETCWGCPIRCKRVVEATGPVPLDPTYGGPEFEALMMLGSNLGLGDLVMVAKANELCNAYGLDCISTGAMVGFAMECAERGLVPAGGGAAIGGAAAAGTVADRVPLFGDGHGALRLIESIALRRGVGDVLADGYPRATAAWGDACAALAVEVKGQPFPAHMVRVKRSQALAYAVSPIGADHMATEHDWLATKDGDVPRGMGVTEFTEYTALDGAKARATAHSQMYYSLMDTLTLCMFPWGPGSLMGHREMEDLVHATTGWRMTFFELMKAGERRINLMRAFNAREGFDRRHDRLPSRAFEPLRGGPADGNRIDPVAFEAALDAYYAVMGWDPATGAPGAGTLAELGIAAFVERYRG
jgi:aldehyde:ferredoxin oxidoreductase